MCQSDHSNRLSENVFLVWAPCASYDLRSRSNGLGSQRVTAALDRKRWSINLGQVLWSIEEFLLPAAVSKVVLHSFLLFPSDMALCMWSPRCRGDVTLRGLREKEMDLLP